MVRPAIRRMSGYTPGEQPRDGDFIKLNTNENPYAPSPHVVEAIQRSLTGDRLRKYPDPMGTAFRQAAGRVLGIDPDSILIGNGSDDILTILTRALVPENGLVVSPTPSYLLYSTLAEIQGARFRTVPFTADWQLPSTWPEPDASLTFIANPNSPSGTLLARADLQRLIESTSGYIVIDEAYVDFADANLLDLASDRVIITRSLSKSYSLAGIRFGFAVAKPSLIAEFQKVKDSYNCDVLSLAAATAAIDDQPYLHQTRAKITATRQRLEKVLTSLGFETTPSQANFVWSRHSLPVWPIYEQLKHRGILIRYMSYPEYGDGLRISVGTDPEIDRLLGELKTLV